MLSQIEGNMTHLRRLRSNMGSGQQLSAGTTNAVYLAAYDDLNRVSGDASGQGIRRSEWGGMLGFESRMSSESLGGFALSNGWARVNPSGAGTRRYHEEATRLDFYVVGRLGDGWHSVTSLGVGRHDFSLRRELTDGVSAKAGDMEGYSMNLQQEISYSSRIDEQSSMETFLAVESSVNHISSFTEGGAGTASLAGGCRSAWATDVTLGARYIRTFEASGGKGSFNMQAGVVASVGDTTSDMSVHYTGAPETAFSVSTARRNRWGYNLSAGLQLPVSSSTSVTAGAGAVMRGDSKEVSASLGVRTVF